MICIVVSFKFDVWEDLSRFCRHNFSVYCEDAQIGIYFFWKFIKVFILNLFLSIRCHKCVACVLKWVWLKSIAVYELVLISWHRPKHTLLTLDEHTGQSLVLPLGNSTKMGSDCFLGPVVMIPLGRLLRIFLTYSSFASCLDTKTQPIITGQLSSLLSTLSSLGNWDSTCRG